LLGSHRGDVIEIIEIYTLRNVAEIAFVAAIHEFGSNLF
jgi:hypothetical protein